MNPPAPSPHEHRAELEAMVLGDLLGPAGGEDEELAVTVHTADVVCADETGWREDRGKAWLWRR